jgi:endonuclease/exonuclease/phosphatase family metal-dependent hydrolase
MIDAGFVDSAGDVSTSTSEDARRIDYVFVTPDISTSDYTVPDVWVSDHRPVIVELAMPA